MPDPDHNSRNYRIVSPDPANEEAIRDAVNQFAVQGFLHCYNVYPVSMVEEMSSALQAQYLANGVDWIRERSLEIGYSDRSCSR